MCGIAGLIHRGSSANIGSQMTSMLQALKHRGPDSTGFALYGEGTTSEYVMRFKVAEGEDLASGFDIHQQIIDRKASVDERLKEMNVKVTDEKQATEYAYRYVFTFDGDLKRVIDFIEDLDGVEILSVGHELELIKDLGDATVVSDQYSLGSFDGTHAIGHTRMATESDVDIRSAHPYWAYPFNDVSIREMIWKRQCDVQSMSSTEYLLTSLQPVTHWEWRKMSWLRSRWCFMKVMTSLQWLLKKWLFAASFRMKLTHLILMKGRFEYGRARSGARVT